MSLGSEAEFPDGELRTAEARGWKLLVLRAGSDISVLENRCTHAATRLDTGKVKACVVTCPLHGARFDLRDGAVLTGPATRPLTAFTARLENGEVMADLPEKPAPARPKFGVFN